MEDEFQAMHEDAHTNIEKSPWAGMQTLESYHKELESEIHEFKEAVRNNDKENMKEELGDVLWDLMFVGVQLEKMHGISVQSVIEQVRYKFKTRKPWVYGEMDIPTAEQAKQFWQEYKKESKKVLEKPTHKNLKHVFKDFYEELKHNRMICPWAQQHTLEVYSDFLLEEVQELKEGIEKQDVDNIKEELGDLFMVALFTAVLTEEYVQGNLKDIIQGVRKKIHTRKPYIFIEPREVSLEDEHRIWHEVKAQEKLEKNNQK
jgi:uncharacterized protein YabN with tetrapyrrole methylase and pyrophosphatase domain